MFPKLQPVISKKWKVEAGIIPWSPIKEKKRIPQVSKKKQARLKEGWWEWPLFLSIWNEREHCCEECGKKLYIPRPHNFDHRIGKSHWEEYRLNKSNISLICFSCHYMKTNWWVYHGIDYDAA